MNMVMTMSKREVADLIEQFDAYLEETQHDLEALKRLGETEVANVFKGDIGLSFDIVDIRIFPSRYLLKAMFGVTDAMIPLVEFRNGIIRIWFDIDSVQRFKYEVDLHKKTLRLWDYALLVLLLQDKKVQERIEENIGAINTINATLMGILRFLNEYSKQKGDAE